MKKHNPFIESMAIDIVYQIMLSQFDNDKEELECFIQQRIMDFEGKGINDNDHKERFGSYAMQQEPLYSKKIQERYDFVWQEVNCTIEELMENRK